MVQGVWFIIHYLVHSVGTVVVTGVTVLTQVFVPVVAEIPAATWTSEVSQAKFLVSFNFKRHLGHLLFLIIIILQYFEHGTG